MTAQLGMSGPTLGPTIIDIVDAHRSGKRTVAHTAEAVLTAIAACGDDGTWLHAVEREALLRNATELDERPGKKNLPLFGVPFGVKDSLDVAGVPTTLACPDYGYIATSTAPAVQRLIDAGALFVGKTALDQFATGLNGTRTPHTIPRSVYGDNLISGGSSSGSALAVALGQVPFTVATDTAGSGRVPAALNGIYGFKPSRGLISAIGLVPACKSLDCVTVMGGTLDDVRTAFGTMAFPDDDDPWSRERGPTHHGDVRIGLPSFDALDFFGDEPFRNAHKTIREGIDGTQIDLGPFLAAGELLYQGPWVAERLVEFADFLAEKPDSIHPVVREIFRGGHRFAAVDAVRAQQRLQELRAEVARIWRDVDVVVLPTIGTTFTVDEVQARPIDTNSILGHYTHFGNLLDLCGISVPMGVTSDGRPHAVMVLGPARSDDTVLHTAAELAKGLS